MNGVVHTLAVPSSQNVPNWRTYRFESVRLEGVTLAAGAANTIVVTLVGPQFTRVTLDDVLISTAGHLALAEPHRRVEALPQAERDQLLAYLLELDGRDAAGVVLPNPVAPNPPLVTSLISCTSCHRTRGAGRIMP